MKYSTLLIIGFLLTLSQVRGGLLVKQSYNGTLAQLLGNPVNFGSDPDT
jgi:hypothetical protein